MLEDFDIFNEVIDVKAGSENECVGIIIWEDEDHENDEEFTIVLRDEFGEELDVTSVTILNDDANGKYMFQKLL